MKILITEQQLSHIVKNSKLNEQLNIKKSLGLVSVDELNTLESEDIKRGVKKLLGLCEKFEHDGGVYYIFQQIPSLSPENIILKDDRREIALYVKHTPQKGNYRQNIIFYNKLIFDKLLSKYNINDIEYAIKYNIINALIDENVITKKSFNYSIHFYYSHNNKEQKNHPLSRWFDKYVESKTTDEILNTTGLKSLRDLDLDSMKGDEFSDEGLSGFDKFKRNVRNTLTGLDEKESYYVSKLADIFDLASRDENSSNVFNIPDGDGENHKLFHSHSLSCSVFLKNNPAIYDASLVSYFENIGYKFTDLVKKAAEKSSNTELKKSIKYCLSGNPIKVR